MADEPKLWRMGPKSNPGGPWWARIDGRNLNLHTMDLEEAKRLAAEKLAEARAGAASNNHTSGDPRPAPPSPEPPRIVNAFTPARPSVLSSWASSSGHPGYAPPPAAPLAPQLSPSMVALADGLASALAKLNGAAVALSVKHLHKVQPAKIDPDELDGLESAWSTGLQELFALHGVKWWHVVLAQNGALYLSLLQNSTPIDPTMMIQRKPAPAPAPAASEAT